MCPCFFKMESMSDFSGIPVAFYQELFRRFGQDFGGEVVYDLTLAKSKIGEAALSLVQ